MAFAAYAQEQEEDFPPPPPKPTAEMKAEFEKKLATLKTTCATDIANLCSDADGHRLIHCLKEGHQELTVKACQEAVSKIPDHPPRPPRHAQRQSEE
jgi:hypothetical protein